MAAGVVELAAEAERAGVLLAVDSQPDSAMSDLDVEGRIVVNREVTTGVCLALDHSTSLPIPVVPEHLWSEVAWIRLPTPAVGTWDASAAVTIADGRSAAQTFAGPWSRSPCGVGITGTCQTRQSVGLWSDASMSLCDVVVNDR